MGFAWFRACTPCGSGHPAQGEDGDVADGWLRTVGGYLPTVEEGHAHRAWGLSRGGRCIRYSEGCWAGLAPRATSRWRESRTGSRGILVHLTELAGIWALVLLGCHSADPGSTAVRTPSSASTSLITSDVSVPPSVCAPIEHGSGHGSPTKHPRPVHNVLSIGVLVRTSDGMTAGRTIDADGNASGYHMSGRANRPFISEEHGRVSRACIESLFKLAAQVPPGAPDAGVPANESVTTLSIRRSGLPSSEVRWLSTTKVSDPTIRAIGVLYAQVGLGYW